MTMVEKVAIAMATENGADWDALPQHKNAALKAWQATGVLEGAPYRDDYLDMARAALTALLTPTEGMVDAGAGCMDPESALLARCAADSFVAMIQFALSEKTG